MHLFIRSGLAGASSIGSSAINLLVDISLPPASLAVLATILAAVPGRRSRIASILVLLLLLGLGLPIVSGTLLNSLSPRATGGAGPEPSAVVILSADAIRSDAGAGLDPGPLTLDRIRAGAALARRTDLPILVTGGSIPESQITLAGMMQTSLRDDFRLPVRWTEDQSRDTWENAKFSAAILIGAGIRRVYLVTHDWHMQRAIIAFQHFGLDPVPLPVRPAYASSPTWRSFVISPVAWFNSYVALHEWVGLAYYMARG